MKTSLRKSEETVLQGRTELKLPGHTYATPVLSSLHTRYRTDRWKVYSPKLRRLVTFYSTVAYQHWLLIESDPEIDTFCEQPLKIKIRLPEGEVTTLFDIWIRWKSGREEFRAIRSVLPEKRSEMGRQIQAQKKWCDLRNIEHSVITAANVRSNPIYLSNCKFLLRHIADLRHADTSLLQEKILVFLALNGPVSLGDLKLRLDEIGDGVMGAVCELIIADHIEASIRTKLLTMKVKLEVKHVR